MMRPSTNSTDSCSTALSNAGCRISFLEEAAFPENAVPGLPSSNRKPPPALTGKPSCAPELQNILPGASNTRTTATVQNVENPIRQLNRSRTGCNQCAGSRAALAQLVRALDCGSRGPPFKSGRRYHPQSRPRSNRLCIAGRAVLHVGFPANQPRPQTREGRAPMLIVELSFAKGKPT